MGTAKYALTFGTETLLQRICRIVSESTSVVLVVAAPDQEIPDLNDQTVVLRDDRPGEGPLAGIEKGLTVLRTEVQYVDIAHAFVTACDAPLIQKAVIDLLFDLVDTRDAAAIRAEGRLHPLCAVYHKRLSVLAEDLLVAGERRPRRLLDAAEARIVSEQEIRRVDSDLSSLKNANTQEEYQLLRESFEQQAGGL